MITKEVLEKIKPGSELKVYEKNGSVFHGVVLARKHGSQSGATFTVRTTLSDVGVEKVYPIGSTNITKVEIVNFPRKVAKSKLYYLRNVSKKEARRKLGAK